MLPDHWGSSVNRYPIGVGVKSLARGSTFKPRAVVNGVGVPRRRAVSRSTPPQRATSRWGSCLVCGAGPVDAAHLIDRSITTVGQDEVLAVVPLCRACHGAYDDHRLDLVPYLEPHWRRELAFAVERVGLISTVRRVSGPSA